MWDDIKKQYFYRYIGRNTVRRYFVIRRNVNLLKQTLFTGHWSEVENTRCRTNKKQFNLKFYKSLSGFIEATKSLYCKNANFFKPEMEKSM